MWLFVFPLGVVLDSGSPDLVCKKLKALAPTQLEPNLMCWLVCSSVSKFDFFVDYHDFNIMYVSCVVKKCWFWAIH